MFVVFSQLILWLITSVYIIFLTIILKLYIYIYIYKRVDEDINEVGEDQTPCGL